MGIKVYIGGAIHDADTAVVPVFDRGFLYGDSVYEVMRTAGGRPVDEVPHLERLALSAQGIALDPPPLDTMREAIRATLAAADNPESYLRVVVTRGDGGLGQGAGLAPVHATGGPRLIVIAKPLVLPPPEAYREGIALQIVDVQRTPRRSVDPSIKSGNYLNNIMALHQARQAGADEALMCDAAGRVAEGATCNVFIVCGQEVVTPALEIGLLAGLTRKRVIELASAHGFVTREGELAPAQVRAADEVFITSSIRGVVPVAKVDGRAPARPLVGPVTAAIMALYEQFLVQQAGA